MAEPGYDFTKETAERIVRAVRAIESRPMERRFFPGADHFGEPVPVQFRNDSASGSDTIPPYGVGAIIGATMYNGFPLLLIEKPSSEIRPAYLVNGNQAIAQTGHGFGYLSGVVAVQYSTPPTTNYETYGPTSNSWALGKDQNPALAKAIGIISSSTVAGSSATPHMQALWLSPSTAEDVKLAATSENNGDYWSGLHQDYNGTTTLTTGKDFLVASELAGTTPDQNIRLYVDASAISGFASGEAQTLTHDSSDILKWTTAAANEDVKLAASSENDGVYWGGLHAHFNASTVFNSTADFLIESEITGTTPNQDIILFIDNSDIFNYDAAYHQFLMHNASSGGTVWRRTEPEISSGVYNSTQDMSVEVDIDASANLRFFVDISDVTGFSTAAEQYLTNSSGALKFTTGKDEKVSVQAGDTPDYLGAQLTGYSTVPAFELNNDPVVVSEYNAGEILFFIDASAIAGYSASTPQNLSHLGDASLAWTTPSGGGSTVVGTDVLLAVSSQNGGKYWSALHNDYNVSTVLTTGKDLLVESEAAGTTPAQTMRMYVDCSDISGYSPGDLQFLGKATDDILTWSTATSRDEKMAASSENNGEFWDGLHNEFLSATTLSTDKDLLIFSELSGTTPNQNIRQFVNCSTILNFTSNIVQYLTHGADEFVRWGVTTDLDERLAATSENSGKYWNDLHNEYNASTVLTTGKDLLVESEVSGTTPDQKIRMYVDCSDISGFVSTNRQFLFHDTSGFVKWIDATTCTS